MKITTEKRQQFIDMITKFARKHGYSAEFEYKVFEPEILKITFRKSQHFGTLHAIVNFDQEYSLSEAAAPVMAELLRIENNKNVYDYCRSDIDLTKSTYKQLLNSIYGAGHTHIPAIKDVIFNDPATIVFWADGTKTVVKCQPLDEYDPEKGLAMAISKKALGNNYSYYNPFAKWLKRYYKDREDAAVVINYDGHNLYDAMARFREDLMKRFGEVK